MLEIIDNLSLFFEDCYSEFGVREYAREMKMSAPTASKLLKDLEREGLLKVRKERRYLLFRVNRESKILRDLSGIYWRERLEKVIEKVRELSPEAIVLFGSLSKLETKKDSDVDIAILGVRKKNIYLKNVEKDIGREIEIIFYDSLDKINMKLRKNIINGYVLEGYL